MSGRKVQHVDRLLTLAEGDDPTHFSAAEFAEAFGAGAEKRTAEIEKVVEFWPRVTLDLWSILQGDWHALVEPARWGLRGEISLPEARAFALDMAQERMRWPRTDEWRARFGKEHGHKRQPLAGQETLL